MKITIYELLGMAKDGKAPKKIKFNNSIYKYRDKEHGYCRSAYDSTYICLNADYCLFDILNDEVEILEEDKETPKRLNTLNNVGNVQNLVEFADKQQLNNHILKDKLNEIVHYLQYLKSKGE